jgi:adenosylcobinamide-GDP ribazoletransferase
VTASTALAAIGRPVAGAIDQVRTATALLTRIHVHGGRDATGAGAFGLVGAVVGAGGGLAIVLVAGVSALVAGALAVAAMAILSGGLHLDGLADTADALAVGDPARAEIARQDPRVGSAGVVALAVAVVVDAALLSSLATTNGVVYAGLACVVAAAGSRALAAAGAPLARGRLGRGSSAGSGARFAALVSPFAAALALASAILVAAAVAVLVASPAPLVGLLGGLLLAAVAGEWLIRRRGALDGDGIGAMVEIAFASILLVTAIAAGRP